VAAVVLTNVHKIYGHVVAVKDINLDIKDREFVVLVGPSGCGKSRRSAAAPSPSVDGS
jgi:multiple sugar transport system ATP-binding protein